VLAGRPRLVLGGDAAALMRVYRNPSTPGLPPHVAWPRGVCTLVVVARAAFSSGPTRFPPLIVTPVHHDPGRRGRSPRYKSAVAGRARGANLPILTPAPARPMIGLWNLWPLYTWPAIRHLVAGGCTRSCLTNSFIPKFPGTVFVPGNFVSLPDRSWRVAARLLCALDFLAS